MLKVCWGFDSLLETPWARLLELRSDQSWQWERRMKPSKGDKLAIETGICSGPNLVPCEELPTLGSQKPAHQFSFQSESQTGLLNVQESVFETGERTGESLVWSWVLLKLA